MKSLKQRVAACDWPQLAAQLDEQGYALTAPLLNEQRPRAQTRGEAITIERGQFIVFPNRYRPVQGTRDNAARRQPA